MIKSFATLLFSTDTSDKFYAFKTLFPRTWSKVWSAGYDRGYEKAIAENARRASAGGLDGIITDGPSLVVNADNVQVSSDETLTEHLNGDAYKKVVDATLYAGDGRSVKEVVLAHEDDIALLKATQDVHAQSISDLQSPTFSPVRKVKNFTFNEAPKRVAKTVPPINERDAEIARLCAKYPDFAVAKAKYDQARRNGKKSSGFKAEMDAIRAKDAAGE